MVLLCDFGFWYLLCVGVQMADKLHSACLEELAAIENASKEREKEPSEDADGEEEEGLDPMLKDKLER